ncbi:hypothetical protein HPB50_019696 [Hyalomma asiaticum]|uniref:Uncharacterized protein n=1 Tax=Hyalomma asiaticum TaxID=266040 RepID=A0ACB7S7U5_HYAAI|nr:hypothetical protein HPB50_019696 [Hyalomma asiaticum]
MSLVAPSPPAQQLSEYCRDTSAQYARVRRHSVHGGNLEKNRKGGSFLSLSAATTEPGSRPVELYLVVRPPKSSPESHLETSSVSKEADTRPYEEIEFKKGKSNRTSDISIKVTETNGQVTSPPLMVSPVRSGEYACFFFSE